MCYQASLCHCDSRALETKLAHAEGAVAVRWSPGVPHLLATLGRPGAEVKVFSCRTGQVGDSSNNNSNTSQTL